MKKIIATENAPKAVGPYSQAARSGDTLYVSGQLPINPETGKMPEAVSEQARQSMKNIKAILEAAGSRMDKVLRCGIFMANMEDFSTVNEVYASFFEGDYPARATVEVSRLPLGALVEIDAIAEV
jgi:2-iminobutanoate/2-iminopropanoate deaminase